MEQTSVTEYRSLYILNCIFLKLRFNEKIQWVDVKLHVQLWNIKYAKIDFLVINW